MISAPGLGSGLDVSSIVSQLVQVEGEPIANRLNLREAGIQAKISAFGTLKSALSAFGESASALKSLTTFQAKSAASGDKNVFTATATESAAVGSYDIEVVKLAKAHQLTSAGFASIDSVVGGAHVLRRARSEGKTLVAGVHACNSGADVSKETQTCQKRPRRETKRDPEYLPCRTKASVDATAMPRCAAGIWRCWMSPAILVKAKARL